MDIIVDKLASSYRDIVEATLAEDGVSDQQRAILLTKFESLFTDKLRLVGGADINYWARFYRKIFRLGLASTFGKEMNKPIRTEVSVDEALQRGEEAKFNQ